MTQTGCELDDESDNYWDASEEINEHTEAHREDASPQSKEVKEASKDPTNNADHKEENYINSSLQFEADNDPDYSREMFWVAPETVLSHYMNTEKENLLGESSKAHVDNNLQIEGNFLKSAADVAFQ